LPACKRRKLNLTFTSIVWSLVQLKGLAHILQKEDAKLMAILQVNVNYILIINHGTPEK
jgi:hypothetical protein